MLCLSSVHAVEINHSTLTFVSSELGCWTAPGVPAPLFPPVGVFLSWPQGLCWRLGEFWKSLLSSSVLFGSNWLFSSRVISRSSSSPNSPPIRVGSPTTITSYKSIATSDIISSTITAQNPIEIYAEKASKASW